MRLVLAAALLAVSPVSAADLTPEDWAMADQACIRGAFDDQKLSDEKRGEICLALVLLERSLSEQGLCFDAKNRTWRTCRFTD